MSMPLDEGEYMYKSCKSRRPSTLIDSIVNVRSVEMNCGSGYETMKPRMSNPSADWILGIQKWLLLQIAVHRRRQVMESTEAVDLGALVKSWDAQDKGLRRAAPMDKILP